MKKKFLTAALSLILIFAASCCLFGCSETQHTVSFNLGDYTGIVAAPAEIKAKDGEIVELPGTDATWEGYTFTAWTLDGVDYAAGTSVTVYKDITFTAKWTKNAIPAQEVTVSFNLGSGVVGTAPESVTKTSGSKITLPGLSVEHEGFVFDGWLLTGDSRVYKAGEEYTVTKNVTFIAKWKEKPTIIEYTAIFQLGEGVDGDAPASITKPKGETFALPTPGVTREGYKFTGWALPGDDNLYPAGKTFTLSANVTFIAQWAESQAPVTPQELKWLEGVWEGENRIINEADGSLIAQFLYTVSYFDGSLTYRYVANFAGQPGGGEEPPTNEYSCEQTDYDANNKILYLTGVNQENDVITIRIRYVSATEIAVEEDYSGQNQTGEEDWRNVLAAEGRYFVKNQ